MEVWSSRSGFILAAIGSAVGIGNIWRFSTVVGQNGGGAYLIPYLTAVLLVGLPLMILEMRAGQQTRSAIIAAFEKASIRWAGWIVLLVVIGVISYYLVITGWTCGYLAFSLTGTLEPFSDFTGSYLPIFFFILAAILCGAIVSSGVTKGIERVTTVLVPLIFILLIIMLIFAIRLPGAGAGLSYLFTPDFSVLSDPLIWGAALGQAFFSLSVGYGTLLTYGAYLGSGEKIPLSAATVTIADICASLLAGTVIFSIVFTYGLEPAAGPELVFTTLPYAFELMPFGAVFAVFFFLLVFFAATSSAISFIEVPTAALAGVFGISRRSMAAFVTLLLIIIGMPAAASYSAISLRIADIPILDAMDEVFGTIGLSASALLLSIAFAWLFDQKTLWGDLSESSSLIRAVPVLCRYVIPAALLITLSFRVATLFSM
ncbi:sodium-dependent transporter [Methanocalculus sp.]|uniref:sodium-dependent transporter n=1 Tax=Methanocalculus sp. TaxID=2004547 RepID=UPI00271A85E7|nr:sodium-dependent transporter [Methanocalculus sp.]MDO8842273.1 sodium-dependent transporter [Methanocalculus sp.]